jgi:hypothetical protein
MMAVLDQKSDQIFISHHIFTHLFFKQHIAENASAFFDYVYIFTFE